MNASEGVAQDAAARNERPMCRGIARLSGLRWTFGNINEQIEYAGGNPERIEFKFSLLRTVFDVLWRVFGFCEMFFCQNCRTNCAVLSAHKRLRVPCMHLGMHQLQRDEQR